MNSNHNQASDGEAKAKPEVIKLGLDLHARQVTECRQLDGSTPKLAQHPIGEMRGGSAKLLKRVAKTTGFATKHIQIVGAFVFMSTGAVPERRIPSAMVRPGSKSRAKCAKGFPGNLGDPPVSSSTEPDKGRHW